jgi:leucyl aminopeptidase
MVVNVDVKSGAITQQAVDLIIVSLFQGVTQPDGAAAIVDSALGGAIQELIQSGDFSGRAGQTALLYTRGALPSGRVLLLGLGDPAGFGAASAQNAAATAARSARDLGVKTFATVVHGVDGDRLEPDKGPCLSPQAAAQALVEGTRLGLYRFAGHKSQAPEDWKTDPQLLTVVGANSELLAVHRAGVARGEAIASGIALARDWVNEPGNYMTPSRMALLATQLADETGLRIQVLGREAMAELGMGILLSVSAESEQPPQFIVLEHSPAGPVIGTDDQRGLRAEREGLPTVVLIGKGVTFDSGGITLKPGDEMWRMKADMAGAAAVIACLGIAARLNIPVHVVGLAPCAENLPGGRAQKPGDVYTGMTGKTVEVISTDAEGRMLLADALAYATRFPDNGLHKPDAVVDIATLSAAQRIALGPQAAALFSNDDGLASRLQAASDASGERLWRMPIYDEYLEAIKSQVADVKNSGGRYGGVGTSAKFLEHFTEGYPWAHIDMASMSLSEEERPTQPRGATGYAVRLLTAFLEGWAAAS